MWKKHQEDVHGTYVEGDPDVPATHWWNRLWLWLFVWKTVVIFRVPEIAIRYGYRVGFKPASGPAYVKDRIQNDYFFAMRIGREDCTFFAIDHVGREMLLQIDDRTSVGDVRSVGMKLH